MKHFFLAALTVLAVMPCVQAQTDFRHISYDEARQAAKAEGKLLFIDFFTEWCGPCKRMAAQVFPTKEVGDYMNAKFVAVKIDAEKGEGPELAKKYGVKAYPTFVVCDAEGNALGDFAGYKEGQEFISRIESCCNPELKPERVTELYNAGDRRPEIVNAYAVNILENSRDYRDGLAKGVKIVDEYWAGLTDSQRLDPANMFVFETFTYDFDSDRRRFLVENRSKFDPSMAEAVNRTIERLYDTEAMRYLTNNLITDETSRKAFEEFRSSARALGLDKAYEDVFTFAEKHAGMTCLEYVDFVDKNFDILTPEHQGMLMSSIKAAFAPSSPEETKAVSDFARRRIGTLPADQLLWTAYAINDLEAKGH